MGLVTVLYVFVKVSLFLPQWVEVRAFSILIVFSALSFEVLICSLNVSLGSKVSPSILGLRRSSRYPAVRIGALVYADDIAITCDTIDQAENVF